MDLFFLFYKSLLNFVTILLLFYVLFCFVLIYLFLAVLGLRFCARALSSCGKWGPLFIAVRVPLTGAQAPDAQAQ